MESWEKALRKFLENWRVLDNFEGAVATGSYVVGSATPNSDVDVHIILTEKTDWRERGNKVVDGLLIEYFANPRNKFKQYFEGDYQDNKRTNARMLTIGKVMFDTNGHTAKLVEDAKTWFNKPFARPDATWTEIAKYSLWDELDGLQDLQESKQPTFEHMFHLYLNTLLQKYSRFLGAEAAPPAKLFKFITSAEFREKYQIAEYPDTAFVRMLKDCLDARLETKMEHAQAISRHAFEAMGGFEIDGWKIRTPAASSLRRA